MVPTLWMAAALHGQDFRRQPPRQRPGASAQPQATIIEARGFRILRSNGLPNHETGDFPRPGNPNTISAQRYEFRMPLEPKAAARLTPAHGAWFGVAVNGVPFEPGTAEFWNRDPRSGWNYEALSGHINLGIDDHLAHVQPSGAYHYHGLPTGLIASLGGEDGKSMILVGWAADGFPIYTATAPRDGNDAASPLVRMKSSYQLKEERRPGGPGGRHDGTFTADYEFVSGSGDLDECNGRTGVTPEYPGGTYYYCLTEEFPHIGRFWKGTPDPTFRKQGGPPGGGGGGGDAPRRGRRGGPGFGPPLPGDGPPDGSRFGGPPPGTPPPGGPPPEGPPGGPPPFGAPGFGPPPPRRGFESGFGPPPG